MAREDAVRELHRLGIRASTSMGQHFLVDDAVADRQVEFAAILPGETVLEIGPGLGALTTRLAAKARRVIAIEKDRRLAHRLKDYLPEVEVIEGDALRVDWPAFDVTVSNLPYQISSPVVFRLLEHEFGRALLMLQEEFALRMAARLGTGDYSRLTVNVAHRAECSVIERVPRTSFFPAPRVDSAIVSLARREPAYRVADESVFRAVVDACFVHRRKTVENALLLERGRFKFGHERWTDLVRSLPFRSRRAQELRPEDYAEIANEFAAAKG